MKKNKIIQDNVHYFKILGIIVAAICFYVLLNRFSTVLAVISTILDVFTPVTVGLCIAFILNLPLRFFEEKAFGRLTRKNGKVWGKIKRAVCLLLSVLCILSVLVILLSFVIPEFVLTCEKFFIKLPEYMANLESTIKGLAANFNLPIDEASFTIDWGMISSKALELLGSNSSNITQGAIGVISGLFSSVLNFVLGFAISLYILASKEKLGKLVKSFIYAIMSRDHARKLINVTLLSNKAFAGFISGQCIEVLVIGLLCFIGMLIFRFPFALMVSCIISVTAFIPIFGPFIGTAIGAFLILLESPVKAIWFVIFIIILQQIESNVIYPRIMGKQVGLPGIWVLISVTLGGGFFGIVGILVSVPICSVLYTLFDKWLIMRLNKKKICHASMSHDSSEPKTLEDEVLEYTLPDEMAAEAAETEKSESYTNAADVSNESTEQVNVEDTADTSKTSENKVEEAVEVLVEEQKENE